MLVDAIKVCQLKAEEAIEHAKAGEIDQVGLCSVQVAFGLLCLEESLRSDKAQITGFVTVEDLDDYPEGSSDDDPEKELPEERKRREEFKDRGFFG